AGEPPKLGASVGAEIVTAADRTQGIATQQASSQTLCMRRCSVRNALKKVIVVLPILAATAYPDRAGPSAATEQGAVRVASAAGRIQGSLWLRLLKLFVESAPPSTSWSRTVRLETFTRSFPTTLRSTSFSRLTSIIPAGSFGKAWHSPTANFYME